MVKDIKLEEAAKILKAICRRIETKYQDIYGKATELGSQPDLEVRPAKQIQLAKKFDKLRGKDSDKSSDISERAGLERAEKALKERKEKSRRYKFSSKNNLIKLNKAVVKA